MRIVTLFALVMIGTLSSTAAADDKRDDARALAMRGIELLKRGNAAEAAEHLEQAEALFHAPTHLLYLARARAELGDLVEAYRIYDSIIAEPIPAYAPGAFQEARNTAQQELAALEERVPTIEVLLSGAPVAAVTVTIDGRAIPSARLVRRMALTPGDHVLEASAERAETVRLRFHTVAGEETRVVRVEMKAIVPGSKPPTTAMRRARAERARGSYVPGAVSFAVGGAALVVGIVTGALSLVQAQEIDSHCDGDICPLSYEDAADQARLLGNVSTASFVVAGVGLAAGVLLVVIRPGGEDSALEARLGFGAATIGGNF